MDLISNLRNLASKLEQRFDGARGTSRPKLFLNDLMISRTEKIEASEERSSGIRMG